MLPLKKVKNYHDWLLHEVFASAAFQAPHKEIPMLSVVKTLVLFVSSYRPFWVFVEVTAKYSFPDFPSTIPFPRSPFLVIVRHPMFEILSLFRFIQNISRESIW